MQRSVGIPGCGIPTNDYNNKLESPHYRDNFDNRFLYNLNHQHIPHDTTNIYSSLPKQESPFTNNELAGYINIPGAFMKDTNEEMVILQSDQREIHKDVIISDLSNTTREETPRSISIPYKTFKNSSVVQQLQSYSNLHKASAGFVSFNDTYNSTIAFDFGSRNYNLSTSSCKEISSSFNQTFISTQKHLATNTSESYSKFEPKVFIGVSKEVAGKWTSLVYPWERSVGNKVISTASAREISYQTIRSTTSIPQSFLYPSKISPDIFYDATSIPPNSISLKNVFSNLVSSNTGAGMSFSTPWEMGFNNKIMSTASLKEISYQTKMPVRDIPFNFNRNKEPTNKFPQLFHVGINVVSSETGLGGSFSRPWEMGFNNKKLSTSSVREISTKYNKTVSDIPVSSVNEFFISPISGHMLNTNVDLFSSNAGAFFSFSYPWEMGFNNRSISTSTAREISNGSKLNVIDIPRGFQTNYRVKKNTLRYMDLPIRKTKMFSVGVDAMSMGFGSGMSLATPNDMGFNNMPMTSSSIQEISARSNSTVLDCSQGFNTTCMKQKMHIDRLANNDLKNRDIMAPLMVGANLGPRNPFVSPHYMGFDNKPLSISSLREILPNRDKTVYFPHNTLTLGSTIYNPDKEQKLNKNILSIGLKNIVGANVAAQGPSQFKFYPPLGIKGMVKSFSEIYSPLNINTDKDISNELQEPLEGAFMPNVILAREFRGNILLHSKSSLTEHITNGKYNLLFDDLHNARITTNIFGSNLKPLKPVTLVTSKKTNLVPLLNMYTDQKGTANKNVSENQRLQGNLIALSSLSTVDESDNKAPLNKKMYPLNLEIKPKKNEIITLDSLFEKIGNTGRNKSSALNTQPTTFKAKFSEHNGKLASKRNYWTFTSEPGRARILQGSRRPATEEQISGKNNLHVGFDGRAVRRKSLGSVTKPEGAGYYPSLIDPDTPTYGFNENIDHLGLLALNEYYISNPITEVHKKRLSFSKELSPTGLFNIGETAGNKESQLEMASAESIDIINTSTPNPLERTVPRPFINGLVSEQRPVIRKPSPRRKSNALNIFDKFTQVITKSTI
ncbi:hypothetical protein RI543_004669 [Arxiozyma heterogenica]|uniref:Uncharacterized protein n=1 Tax=Arxiozyma heterogenica TaxID=278026 RepID=A0AAN8A7H7_9SACH|nr:hypothetical protein RI543_004669 [Kazachstania heterogenica]